MFIKPKCKCNIIQFRRSSIFCFKLIAIILFQKQKTKLIFDTIKRKNTRLYETFQRFCFVFQTYISGSGI